MNKTCDACGELYHENEFTNAHTWCNNCNELPHKMISNPNLQSLISPCPKGTSHEWTTKYSTHWGVVGVEWYCSVCFKPLSWSVAIEAVNTITKQLAQEQMR